ncbi:unnamed protein product [Cochlearia groenlandica]
MEHCNVNKDENNNTLEASVVENENSLEASVVENAIDAVMNSENVVNAEAENSENVVGETLKEPIEEQKTEDVAAEVPSVLASIEASSSVMKKPKGLLAKKRIIKKVKKLVKKKVLKGTAVQVAANVTVEQGVKKDAQSAEEPSRGESGKEIEKVNESAADSPQRSSGKQKDSLGEELDEFAEAPADDSENVAAAEPSGEVNALKSVGKRLLKGKKVEGTLAHGTEASPGGSVMDAEKLNSLEVNTNEVCQEKNEEKAVGLAEGKRRRKKRRGKQDFDSNKKQKTDVAADVTQQRVEDGSKQLVDPTKKEETDEQGKENFAGLIFMCNAKTRPDCFRFSVMGVQEKRKDYVMNIKPGIKLFLYDYDLKLLYGVFQASSAGGMKLERNAFGGSFPAQVRFKVVSDCIPLPESQFKKAILENYNNRNKFKTELTRKQVFKLSKLFRPASLPAQLTHTQPIPVPRAGQRKRPDKNHRNAPGNSSRTHLAHESFRNATAHVSTPLPRREEPPRDLLYLSEREYRTYGLRGTVEPTQHYQIPPPDSSYRDRVPLDPYRPSLVDHDRHLRQADFERHEHRESHLLRLPERDYQHAYDHLSSRREVLARSPPSASLVGLDSYRRDPYYRYEYHRSPERQQRTYMASSGREGGREDDLYSRYVTADSLAEYYGSSLSSARRYQSIAESEIHPSSLTSSRYGYSGTLPYSHR